VCIQLQKKTDSSAITINGWKTKLKNSKLEIGQDEPAGIRSMKEKLELLLVYQKIPAKPEGEWLRQKGIHREQLPLFRHEISSIMTNRKYSVL
jgi:hypothetical protein